jgi:hypothetical protein
MQTTKRYTNQTFTRRVDDEKGRHRTPRAIKEPATCEVCGDTYVDRRWTMKSTTPADARDSKHDSFRPATMVVCPACQRQKEGVPSGFVYLEGKFLETHRDQIKRTLDNEAARSLEDNPLARIMYWQDEGGKLIIATTTEHLAQRLGHALSKAFDGEVRYDFSHRNKLARVWWRRD